MAGKVSQVAFDLDGELEARSYHLIGPIESNTRYWKGENTLSDVRSEKEEGCKTLVFLCHISCFWPLIPMLCTKDSQVAGKKCSGYDSSRLRCGCSHGAPSIPRRGGHCRSPPPQPCPDSTQQTNLFRPLSSKRSSYRGTLTLSGSCPPRTHGSNIRH